MVRIGSIVGIFLALLAVALPAQKPEDSTLLSAMQEGRFAEAVSLADASLKNRADDPWLWTVRGMALEGLGQTAAGLQSEDKALALDAAFVPALKASAQIAYLHHDPKAATYVDRWLKVRPQESSAHAMAGVLAFEANDCTAAILHFSKITQIVARSEKFSAQYSSCLLVQHRPSDAVNVLTEARVAHPASRNLRYDLALAQQQNGQVDQALATLQPADDDDAGILNLRASLESAAGKLDAAVADLRRAIDMEPLEERNYLDLAMLGIDSGHEKASIDVLAVGIKNLPADAKLYAVRGIAYAQIAKYDEAQADFARAAELDPQSHFGGVAQTVIDVEKAHPEKAIASLRDQVKKTPSDAVADTLLANLLMRGGATPGTADFAEAKAAVKRALQADPNEVQALNLLGAMDQDENDLAGALSAFVQANALAPDNRATLNQMLLLLRRLGRKDEAVQVAARLRALLSNQARESNQDGVRTGSEN